MAGRKRLNPSADHPKRSRSEPVPVSPRASDGRARHADWPREAGDASPLKSGEGGVSLGQIPMAEFARMSTSRQLSLWAILRAQISSQKALAARRPRPLRKVLPLSPEE